MPTSKIYIPGENPWYCEMVFSTPKDNKGELVFFLYLRIIILVIKVKSTPNLPEGLD